MKKTSKSICIAAGGTGGHLFPAQALASKLQEKEDLYDLVFMGKGLTENTFFRKDMFAYKDVAGAPFSSKSLFKNIKEILKGTWQSFVLLIKSRPAVVIGFGSYHSFPVLLAAKLSGIPIILFESNSVPGKVNRLFSYLAVFSTVQFPAAKKHLKGECFEVHVPFWRLSKKEGITKKEALDYFSLSEDRCTFLVFGGSQGANFINEVFLQTLQAMGKKACLLQVIHLTGKKTSAEEVLKVYQESGILACVKPFEENMQFAWTAADVTICRSGAATLSELIHFEVPAVLIPYPYATERHQLKNALFMEEMGGAFCLEEKNISKDNFLSLIEQFLDNNNNVLQTMKTSINDFKRKQASCSLSDLIEKFIREKKRR